MMAMDHREERLFISDKRMRSILFKIIFLSLIFLALGVNLSEGKKIKYSFNKEKENIKTKKLKPDDDETENIIMADTAILVENGKEDLLRINFAGYEKEANSNKESFIIVNPTGFVIKGYEVKIDYLDLQGRMLHSQTIRKKCKVPPGESRKLDIPSWDTQHTYFYYLGNEPKKVATPYKVKIIPLAFEI